MKPFPFNGHATSRGILGYNPVSTHSGQPTRGCIPSLG
jgi:hypothetical protein